MTKDECAIVMAYTGKAMLQGYDINIFYHYIEHLMGRPVYTHEIPTLTEQIKTKSKKDFIMLCENAINSMENERLKTLQNSISDVMKKVNDYLKVIESKTEGIKYITEVLSNKVPDCVADGYQADFQMYLVDLYDLNYDIQNIIKIITGNEDE